MKKITPQRANHKNTPVGRHNLSVSIPPSHPQRDGRLVITEDSPGPMIAFFVVEGGLIYLDKPTNGGFTAYEDGFTLLELTRKHYREAGLDVRELDALVR